MTKLNLCRWIATVLLLLAATAIGSSGQTFTTLHSFDGSDGANPTFSSLVQGLDGNLYGTTAGQTDGGGAGTVFKMTPGGTLTTLHKFCARHNCADGSGPYAGLDLATNGTLYGTTAGGGSNSAGTTFKISASGTLTTLHVFDGSDDLAFPYAGLVQANDGSFYGTAELGGRTGGGPNHGGIFRTTAAGVETVAYGFCNEPYCPDGSHPFAGLVQGTDGNFYGTTSAGGAGKGGTVFKVTPDLHLMRLHSFATTDGAYPYAGLIQATDGNFYGTTELGGANGGGTIFQITPNGALTTLYSFCAQADCADGKTPVAGLTQATDGNLYGTTELGGANGAGTIFEIAPGNTLTTLYSFCAQTSCADGEKPLGGLFQATDGSLYGATSGGGTSNFGTIFRLAVGLGPFVETLPAFSKAGRALYILGTNLTGATGVSFNGTAATFTIVSSSEIKTIVPTGATTGFVSVSTPSGTLSSNVVFRVAP
jgi:uncharacterized repeat protein (TIGR03803 family)